MKRLSNCNASCHQVNKRPRRERLQELAYQIRETLEGLHQIPAGDARISGRYNIPLDNILLALGYESSLVEMLGRRYSR